VYRICDRDDEVVARGGFNIYFPFAQGDRNGVGLTSPLFELNSANKLAADRYGLHGVLRGIGIGIEPAGLRLICHEIKIGLVLRSKVAEDDAICRAAPPTISH
jgi:hypothetical protein